MPRQFKTIILSQLSSDLNSLHASSARVITQGGVYHGAVWKKLKWWEDYVCARGAVTHYITVIECIQTTQVRPLGGLSGSPG